MGQRYPFSVADLTAPAKPQKGEAMIHPYPFSPSDLAAPIAPVAPQPTIQQNTMPEPEYDAPHWSYLHGCQKHRGEVVPCLKCIQARDPEITRDGVIVFPPMEWTYGSPTVDAQNLDWNTLTKHQTEETLPNIAANDPRFAEIKDAVQHDLLTAFLNDPTIEVNFPGNPGLLTYERGQWPND